MKIFIVSYFFPPYNCSVALRSGSLAKFLVDRGHEVKVLSARAQPLPEDLAVEIDVRDVIYTNWFNVNFLPELFIGGRKQVAEKGFSSSSGVLTNLGWIYQTLFNFPDGQIGWLPFALHSGRKLLKKWKPDIIFGFARAFTSLIVASRLSSEYKIPWVAQFQDLWVDNAKYKFPQWRKRFDENLEKKTLKNVSGLVTVSSPLLDRMKEKYAVPGKVILNGYNDKIESNHQIESEDLDVLNITYTGIIHPESQDLSPLSAALALMGERAKHISINYYGKYTEPARISAEKFKVGHLIHQMGFISHRESLLVQSRADILLLLLWNDPKEKGVMTGKIFEYLAARRPILAIGLGNDVAGDLIRERKAGVVTNNPEAIAVQLERWLEEKKHYGMIASLPESVCKGLSRYEQLESLESFLLEKVGH